MKEWLLLGTGLYTALMLAVGYFSSRQIKSLSDYLVAGRHLPFPIALATLFATWFGAGTCMGASGMAYQKGILGVIADPFAAGLSLLIASLFYVGILRRMNLLTVTDVFKIYYGKSSEIFASLLMIPVYVGWLGSQMVALGFLLNLLTGLNTTPCILIASAVVLLYTYAGGMWAVTLTDCIQVVILILGLLIIFPVVISHAGGFQTLFGSTPRELWHFYPQTGQAQDWVSYFGQFALLGLGTVVGQDLIQRSLSSKTDGVAKSSAWWAGILYLTVGLIPVLLGLAGRVLYPEMNEAELIMPYLALKFLPPVVFVFFIGALVSAIMSSADSSLLAAASLLTHNVLHPLFPQADDQTVLRWTKNATLILGLLSLGVALYVKEIYNLMINSWATLFVAIFVPVTAALYWSKANKKAAWVSMIAGVMVWIGFIWIRSGNLQEIEDLIFYQAAFYGGVASLAGYLLTTGLFYSKIESVKPGKLY